MINYEFLPQANNEFIHAVTYYTDISPELGAAFITNFEKNLNSILRFPEIGNVRLPEFPGIRFYDLNPRFPYSILYVYENDLILIVAAAHQSKEHGYWKDRI